MNTEHDAVGEMSQDLEVVRNLIQKYGLRNFNSLTTIASSRDSTASFSSQSFISGTATPVSRATTSSSFYPESMSTDRTSAEVQFAQWEPVSTPLTTTYSVTSIDPPPPIAAQALISESGRELETDASGDSVTPKYQCPLCSELGIDNRIKRKNDLKRHLMKLHSFDCQWICKFQIGSGCGAAFDFSAAYDDHVKREHSGFRDQDAKVNLCQQVVYACGFERCREVFEAANDVDGQTVRVQYFDHILSHLSAGAQVHWSYRRRMRNLLRQNLIHSTWKDYNRDLVDLIWYPESSALLRKLLECRHIVNIPLLCQYAVQLGSAGQNFAPPVPPVQLTMPLLNECNLASHGHQPRQDIRFSQMLMRLESSQQHTTTPFRSRASPRSSPYFPSQGSFTPHLAPPGSRLCHELPQPPMTLASQHMDVSADSMDDMEIPGLILFPIHKSLERFLGSVGDMPLDDQHGFFLEDHGPTLPGRSRTSSRRHLLAKKSMENLRIRRHADSGECQMVDMNQIESSHSLAQTTPAPTFIPGDML